MIALPRVDSVLLSIGIFTFLLLSIRYFCDKFLALDRCKDSLFHLKSDSF